MATPPLRTALADTYPNPTNATMRTGMGALWDYVTTLLGATGTPADARAALGWGDGQLGAHRNKVIGHFAENQRALTSVADDAYCLDRWYVLTESGNVGIAQITDPESGAPYALRLTQPDATAKRMGLATIIEAKNIKAYRNVAMNFAARVKPSFTGNVRYAILEHTGTADVVTSDVVNNWASATFTPSNFFIAGVTVLKTGTVAPGAATYGDLSDWSALGASTNNVILFVWTEAAQAQNATLELNRPQYEPGVIRTPQEWRLNELALCQRYYYQSWGAGAWSNNGGNFVGMPAPNALTQALGCAAFPVLMRATPTIVFRDDSGSVGKVSQPGLADNLSATAVNISAAGFSSALGSVAYTISHPVRGGYTASVEL